MIRAVIFDFNGVIIDDEPVHFKLFQRVLKAEGVRLSEKDYYAKYLGMDDKGCFATAMLDVGKDPKESTIQRMIQDKADLYIQSMASETPFMAGVLDFITQLAKKYFIAIVSGALRHEITMALSKRPGIAGKINVLIAAEDVQHGKPNPEGYERALAALNRDFMPSSERLLARECLVIEDSIWGIEAALAAGMPCVAITSSYPAEELPGAVMYLENFEHVKVNQMMKSVESK